eukprot:363929-Chlamydomonas_euryale.AAC.2
MHGANSPFNVAPTFQHCTSSPQLAAAPLLTWLDGVLRQKTPRIAKLGLQQPRVAVLDLQQPCVTCSACNSLATREGWHPVRHPNAAALTP